MNVLLLVLCAGMSALIPGKGFHHTVKVPDPVPADLAQALSSTFSPMPNPAPAPKNKERKAILQSLPTVPHHRFQSIIHPMTSQ